jgi:hypothetical protein
LPIQPSQKPPFPYKMLQSAKQVVQNTSSPDEPKLVRSSFLSFTRCSVLVLVLQCFACHCPCTAFSQEKEKEKSALMVRRSASSVPCFRGFGTCRAATRFSLLPSWSSRSRDCAFAGPLSASSSSQLASPDVAAAVDNEPSVAMDYSRRCLIRRRTQTLVGSTAAHASSILVLLRCA